MEVGRGGVGGEHWVGKVERLKKRLGAQQQK